MSRRKPQRKVQRRTVGLSISAPVFATLTVERDVSDPDNPGDWEVVRVTRADCDLSPRAAMECMGDVELAELDRLADEAKDEEA